MKRASLTALCLLSLCPGYAAPPAADKSPVESHPLLEASRQLTRRFATELKAELKQALNESGPANAVAVCRDRAPQIAAHLARESGARVGRTSVGFRNPQNAPAPWQRAVLQRFDESSNQASEWFEADTTPGVTARYMKAIPSKPLCLACHGTPDGAVKEQLEQAYPYDRATGYQVGDIRGAFYVEWLSDTRR